jgi:hypothetical protein
MIGNNSLKRGKRKFLKEISAAADIRIGYLVNMNPERYRYVKLHVQIRTTEFTWNTWRKVRWKFRPTREFGMKAVCET